MADHDIISQSSALSHKAKIKSAFCFPCCFHHPVTVKPRQLDRSSSLQARPRPHDLPHLKEKCSNFIARISRHHRRHSTDFHYDALSYSLNFEDEASVLTEERNLDDFRNFSSRLPQSPRSSSATTAMEIAALS